MNHYIYVRDSEEDEKNAQKATVLIAGSFGVGLGVGGVLREVQSLDLNLLSTASESGVPTGHGNMFENCIVREHPGAVKVNNPGCSINKLFREKNGVDIRFSDGTNVQCKCYSTPEGAVKSMMKGGKFRYDGQTIMVPKGQIERVKLLLKEQGVNTPVMESMYTYEQVKKLTIRGRESVLFEATNQVLIGRYLFLAVLVGGCIFLYEQFNNPQNRCGRKC